MLENFYKKSRNSIEAGKNEAPYGYVIPADQADMTRVAFIVNLLRLQGIEVGRTTAEVKLKEGTYPAGSLSSNATSPTDGSPRSCWRSRTFPTQRCAPTTTPAGPWA